MSAAKIDLQGVRREFVHALDAERKYERENDAKFRAVNQRVATYEEFRDIVKASHLQPLERKDIVGGARKQPWNSACSSGTLPADGTPTNDLLKGCGQPVTAQELVRQWRQLKGNQKQQYELLVSLQGDTRHKLLRSEVSASLLGEMLVVLNKCYNSSDIEALCGTLRVMATTPRFQLSLALLSRGERDSVRALLVAISGDGCDDDLMELFGSV